MIFDELADIYFDIDRKYSISQFEAQTRRYNRIEAKYRRKREGKRDS